MTGVTPREGMMAVVRNRRALIAGVQPFDADEADRFHLVEVEYTDGTGAESDEVLWEVEPGTEVLEPAALPRVEDTAPMDPREFDAVLRASRWSALTPSLPFSGLDGDRPPLAAPFYGAIHPEAYQLVPVLRALEMPRVALLLADAVGLGKTIQAGMVLRELMLRRRIRRVLVLCPAALRSQWREEMQEKFALPFELVDRPQTLKLQREIGIDANAWRSHDRIIASYHYLKQPDVLEQFRAAAEPDSEGRLRWDLLIVDEAHNLAPASFGSDSDVSQMLQRIASWFEHRVFLTATPHNGHTRSFSGLLEALDPVRFTRKSELDGEDRRRVGEAVIRRLKSEVNACYTALGELRHTVLALAVFGDLAVTIDSAGNRDAGIQTFFDQHGGDGWMLPETLCLADLGLIRSADAGAHDERARTPQPVRSRFGERFLDWQLAQTADESWAECERHARAIRKGRPRRPAGLRLRHCRNHS